MIGRAIGLFILIWVVSYLVMWLFTRTERVHLAKIIAKSTVAAIVAVGLLTVIVVIDLLT